jgi:hypothetical protein
MGIAAGLEIVLSRRFWRCRTKVDSLKASNGTLQGQLVAVQSNHATGGTGNAAGGRNTVVIGGQNVTDNIDNSIVPKPPFP